MSSELQRGASDFLMAQMPPRPLTLLMCTASPASETSEIPMNGTTTPANVQVRNLS